MREVKPYRTLEEAVLGMDNGGRLNNPIDRSDDHWISPRELARAAGVKWTNERILVFFEMALAELSTEDRSHLLTHCTPALIDFITAKRPAFLPPERVETDGLEDTTAIITGYPRLVRDASQISGHTRIPLAGGKMHLPLPVNIQGWDLYTVHSDPDPLSPFTTVAIGNNSTPIVEGSLARFGGVLRGFHPKDAPWSHKDLYLEIYYFTSISTTVEKDEG